MAGPGRPKKETPKSNAGRKPKAKEYRCNCCGVIKKETEFFMSNDSGYWRYSKGRVLFCKECIEENIREISNRFNEEVALADACAKIDAPFYRDLYKSLFNNSQSFSFGRYLRCLNGTQWKGKTFLNTLLDEEISFSKIDFDAINAQLEQDEANSAEWTKDVLQNKSFAVSVVGYDPFTDSSLSELDKIYCFNTLASYCDGEGVSEDPHKVQSVVEMTFLHLQCRKLNELINRELLAPDPDDNKVKTLSETKSKLIASISKIAQDNNISSNNNATSKAGKNALTSKMKEMFAEGYRPIEVNLFDIKTSAAMKQVADLSNQSLLEQLALEDNDWANMVKEQRELVCDCQDKISELEEANRILQNKILELESR